jgi:hypothetical protein
MVTSTCCRGNSAVFVFAGGEWTPHKVELAVWTHFVVNELKPELLADMPGKTTAAATAAVTTAPAVSANGTTDEAAKAGSIGEDSNSASESANGNGSSAADFDEDSNQVPIPPEFTNIGLQIFEATHL